MTNLLALITFWAVALAAVFLDLRASRFASSSAPYPNRPIEVVVPFAPGGESDTFARHVIKPALEKHGELGQPIVIVNRGGAGGTIGSRSVKNASPDGYTVLLLHEAILTAKHYGNALYGPEAFEPVSATGENVLVLVASSKTPFASLHQLMTEAKARPDTVTFGVNLGAPTHFIGLMLEKRAPGARFRFVQSGGGAHRLRDLIGGHLDVTAFSVSEYVQFRRDEMRPLAVFSESAHPALPGVPTAKQTGCNVVGTNAQMWWMPKGTPPDRVMKLAEALRLAMQSEEVKAKLRVRYVEPTFRTGKELQSYVEQRDKELATVQQRKARDLPNFPLLLGSVLGFCGLALIIDARRRCRSPQGPGTFASIRLMLQDRRILFTATLTVLYALALSSGVVGFRWATMPFVLGLGLLLTEQRRRALPTLAPLTLLLSFGLHWLFTQALDASLP